MTSRIAEHLSSVSLKNSERRRFLDLTALFSKARILVIGDFILDQFIWGSVDRISPEAPVPVVNVTRESYAPGGALNAAHNIHALGGKVIPCGVVGTDNEARVLRNLLKQKGIETSGVFNQPGRPTTVKTRIIAHAQHVVRFDRETTEAVPREILRKIQAFIKQALAQADVLMIEDYGKGVLQPSLLKEIIRQARRLGKPVLVDPKPKNFPYYRGAAVITPNRKEAFEASNCTDVDKAGKSLLKKMEAKAVLMTLGEKGMALFEKDKPVFTLPATAREVYDVSGAGDTVIAVFALALAAGANLREAALLSNQAAGLVVAKLGTATVSAGELRESVLTLDLKKRGGKHA